MKRYKLINIRRCKFIFEKDELKEAIINPKPYFKILNNIFFKIKNDVKKFNETKLLCNFLTNEFKVFKIIFEFENSIDSLDGVNGGGTDTDIFNIIYIFLNQNILKYIKNDYDKFVKNIMLVIQHEFIHRNQAIRMKSLDVIEDQFKEIEDEYKYYSDKHEIMAYAWHILEVLRRQGIDNDKILRAIQNNSLIEPHYNKYIELFGKNSPQIKTLVKYMYMYLQD